ncbi:hypothetical protein F4810DRAFT_470672 [Camillea tinctor]|nr:hypothetical protein F4810DRAFT_470672 [Camillea tinctor]
MLHWNGVGALGISFTSCFNLPILGTYATNRIPPFLVGCTTVQCEGLEGRMETLPRSESDFMPVEKIRNRVRVITCTPGGESFI